MRASAEQGSMDRVQTAADAVNVHDARRRIGVRREAQRVDGVGDPAARPPEGLLQGAHAALEGHGDMVEPVQEMDPIFISRDPGGPHLVDPADARPALLLPPLDRVQHEKVGPVLAEGDEQVVVPFEADRPEAGVQGRHRPGEIHPDELLLQLVPEREARAGRRADQVDVVDLRQHVLGFVDGPVKDGFPKFSPGRHADAGLNSSTFGVGPQHLILFKHDSVRNRFFYSLAEGQFRCFWGQKRKSCETAGHDLM